MKKDILEEQRPRKRRYIGFIALWVVAWPAVIGIVAVMVLIGVGAVMQLQLGATPPNGANIRAFIAYVTVALVVICLLLIFLQRRSRELVARVGATVLSVYMWAGIALAAVVIVAIPDTSGADANGGIHTQATAAPVVPELAKDPAIAAVLQQVGASDVQLIDYQYVDGYNDPAFPDKEGEYQSFINTATGGFVYGKLTLKRGMTPENERIIAAHEYLHHVWFKLLDKDTKENLTAHLIGMYGNDGEMHKRVQDYVKNGTLYPTELFSYYCTESSNGYLTQYVLDQCNKYINRSTLVLQR